VRFANQYGRIVITIAENHPSAQTLLETDRRRYSLSLESPHAESTLLNLLLGDKPSTYYHKKQAKDSLGAFTGLVAEFTRILREYPVSEREYQELRSVMQEKWQDILRHHGSKGTNG
jgi:hypothetical protein